MKTPLLIAAPLLAGCLLVGAAAPAFADGAPSPAPKASHAAASLSQIQAKGAADTSKRIASLTAAITKVGAAKGISSSDRSTVLGTLGHDLDGMKSLASKIAADTSASTARADVKSIYTTYRVYAVALPQARIAGTADRLTGIAIPKLKAVSAELTSKVAGKSDLQAKLDDMNSQLATASSDADGLASAALGVTPSDYNGDHAAMTGLRSKAKAAVAAAKQAAQDAKAIRQGLKPASK
jgi:hypothetical protein